MGDTIEPIVTGISLAECKGNCFRYEQFNLNSGIRCDSIQYTMSNGRCEMKSGRSGHFQTCPYEGTATYDYNCPPTSIPTVAPTAPIKTCVNVMLLDKFGDLPGNSKLFAYDNKNTYKTYATTCDVNPIYFSYCFDTSLHEDGDYVMFLIHGFHVPFEDDIQWQVFDAQTKELYTGNYKTVMKFIYHKSIVNGIQITSVTLSKSESVHIIPNIIPCESCLVNNGNGVITDGVCNKPQLQPKPAPKAPPAKIEDTKSTYIPKKNTASARTGLFRPTTVPVTHPSSQQYISPTTTLSSPSSVEQNVDYGISTGSNTFSDKIDDSTFISSSSSSSYNTNTNNNANKDAVHDVHNEMNNIPVITTSTNDIEADKSNIVNSNALSHTDNTHNSINNDLHSSHNVLDSTTEATITTTNTNEINDVHNHNLNNIVVINENENENHHESSITSDTPWLEDTGYNNMNNVNNGVDEHEFHSNEISSSNSNSNIDHNIESNSQHNMNKNIDHINNNNIDNGHHESVNVDTIESVVEDAVEGADDVTHVVSSEDLTVHGEDKDYSHSHSSEGIHSESNEYHISSSFNNLETKQEQVKDEPENSHIVNYNNVVVNDQHHESTNNVNHFSIDHNNNNQHLSTIQSPLSHNMDLSIPTKSQGINMEASTSISRRLPSIKNYDVRSPNEWFSPDRLGASYQITDESGMKVFYMGTLCKGFHDLTVNGSSGCHHCLAPGSYIYRVDGAFFADKDKLQWEFCGQKGGASNKLSFIIGNDGSCNPLKVLQLNEVCKADEARLISEAKKENCVTLSGTFDLGGDYLKDELSESD
eukprot:gene13420-28457_t